MEWLSLTLGLVGAVSGLAALALSWMTRRDLKQQTLLQAALEIDDAAPDPKHRYMPGKVLLLNPAPFPVRIIKLTLMKPSEFIMTLTEESFTGDRLVPLISRRPRNRVRARRPPSSGRGEWTDEILLFFWSTARKTSQITCSVRLTYQEINDRRRIRTITITSNEVTAHSKPRLKLSGTQDISGASGS